MYARLKVMRLGAARLAYQQLPITIFIDSQPQRMHVRVNGVSITDDLNHAPNTCSFRCSEFVPRVGQHVRIYQGSAKTIFAGIILSVTTVYEGRPEQVAYDVQCIDFTFVVNRRPVLARYVNLSATTIIQDLIARFATVAGSAFVEPNLPIIDEVTFTNDYLAEAITRVMARVGGYWFVDADLMIHAFLTQSAQATAITQAASHTMADIRYSVDLSQLANRVTARGYGESALVDIDLGATSVPLEDTGLKYSATGGVCEVRQQRITYTGFAGSQPIGTTALGAMGVVLPPAPSTALAMTGSAPTPGSMTGVYQYALTYAQGSASETTPGPLSAPLFVGVQPPGLPLPWGEYVNGNPGFTPGMSLRFAHTFLTSVGETTLGPVSDPYIVPPPTPEDAGYGYHSCVQLWVNRGPAGTLGRRVYISINGGPFSGYQYTYNNVETQNTSDWCWLRGTPAALNQDGKTWGPPVDSTAGGGRVNVTLPIGPTGTTARKIYRTTAGGTFVLLLRVVSDNTTTAYIDNDRDTSLGAAPPTTITTPTPAGATGLLVVDLAPFPTGGWARAGPQPFRYTGRQVTGPGTTGILTGIPASGVGSLLAPVSYGSEVLLVPHLLGVAGIVIPIQKGDTVAVVAQVDDAASQTMMAGIVNGGDGIYELFITDGRWSLPECYSQAEAALALRKDPLVTVTFVSRDPSLESGATVAINLTSPPIVGTFRIQRVTLADFGRMRQYVGTPQPRNLPLRTVECSSVRYSIEDLLRLLRGARDS
jgi:hypothetical protein